LRAFSVLLVNVIVMGAIFGSKIQQARPETHVVGGTRASIMSSPPSGTFMIRSAFGSQVASSMHPGHSIQQLSALGSPGGSGGSGGNSNNSGATRALSALSPQLTIHHHNGNNGGVAHSPPSATSPGGLVSPNLVSPNAPFSSGGGKQLHTNAALISNHHSNSHGNGLGNGSDRHLHGNNNGSHSPVLSPGQQGRPGSGFNARHATLGSGSGATSPLQQSHSLGSHHSGANGNSNGVNGGIMSHGSHTIGTSLPATNGNSNVHGNGNDTSNGNVNDVNSLVVADVMLPPPQLHDTNASVTPIVG
jgi:hypothetical protein